MAHLDIHRFINAPPEAVWDVLADVERQGDWMVDVRRLTITSDARQGVGTVIDVTSDLFGRPIVRDIMEFTAWEPPSRMDVWHRGRFSGRGQFLLETVDDGTLFTWIEDFEPPLGRLGEAVFAVVVRPHLLRVFARSMANVQRLAEARVSAPVSEHLSI